MNGYFFLKEDIKVLIIIILKVVLRGKLSFLVYDVVLIGKGIVKNFMVVEVVEGYVLLLENIFKLLLEVVVFKVVVEIFFRYRSEWKWNILNIIFYGRF